VRRVQLHSEATPLFQRHGVEDQLSAMYQPVVQLKSGGYLVINPTEALVSIDINSGRSTREHNIEQTAFQTNLEAAAEIARQLRLRDMAGLVVIDFIDMEQNSHVRKVEKAMKDALKNDRARIQVGRISSFGLMEMSRQRLRTGVLEASTKACPHCDGTGLMRTASSAGLSALRIIEDEAARGRGDKILLRAGREAAIYLLNKKRGELSEIEERYGVSVEVLIDEAFEGARMSVESSGPRPTVAPRPQPTSIELDLEEVEDILEDEEEDEGEHEDEGGDDRQGEGGDNAQRSEGEDRNGRRRRRRRRGGRGRSRREDGEGGAPGEDQPAEAAEAEQAPEAVDDESIEPSEDRPRSRRRRRRGGRSGGHPEQTDAVQTDGETPVEPDSSPMVEHAVSDEQPIADTAVPEPATDVQTPAEAPKRRGRKAAAKTVAVELVEPAPADAAPAETAGDSSQQEEPPAKKPARRSRAKKAEPAPEEQPQAAPEEQAEPASSTPPADNDSNGDTSDEPRRGGWWQRTFG
jgi:ribonuclease E